MLRILLALSLFTFGLTACGEGTEVETPEGTATQTLHITVDDIAGLPEGESLLVNLNVPVTYKLDLSTQIDLDRIELMYENESETFADWLEQSEVITGADIEGKVIELIGVPFDAQEGPFESKQSPLTGELGEFTCMRTPPYLCFPF